MTARPFFTEADFPMIQTSFNALRCQSALCSAAVILMLSGVITAQESSDKNAQSARNETVYEIGNGVTPPKGISMPNPGYSEKARKKKISGTVVVAMVVMPDGNVRDVTVIKSLEKSLDEQAIGAVKNWTFEPATKDGKPVAVHVRAEVSFRIR
jgi:TonB family protein